MLPFLVSAPSRQKLLESLWEHGRRGSVTYLARESHLSFATAYRELRAMLDWNLVTCEYVDGVAIYAANLAHPVADALRAVVTYRRSPDPTIEDNTLRAQLAELGAPVMSSATEVPPVTDLEVTVVAGAALARREPQTLRSMPVLLHEQEKSLDFDRLRSLSQARGVRHALGFLLAVTAHLRGDRRLMRVARTFRDHRVRRQGFMFRPIRGEPMHFPLAESWGYRMRMDEAIFAKTFRQFTRVMS